MDLEEFRQITAALKEAKERFPLCSKKDGLVVVEVDGKEWYRGRPPID